MTLMELVSSQCELCAEKGIDSRKRYYQLNLEEAVLFCENEECSDLARVEDINCLIIHREAKDCVGNITAEKPFSVENKIAPVTDSSGKSFPPIDYPNELSVIDEDRDLNFDDLLNILTDMEDGKQPTESDATAGNTFSPVKSILLKQLESPTSNNKITSINSFSSGGISQRDLDFAEKYRRELELQNMVAAQQQANVNLTVQLTANNNVVCNGATSNNNVNCSVKNNTLVPLTGMQVLPSIAVSQSQLSYVSVIPTLPTFANFNLPTEIVVATVALPVEPQLKKYPQWTNSDALCWLDVTLNLLVHNISIRREIPNLDNSSIIKDLCTEYDKAVEIFNSTSYQNKRLATNNFTVPATVGATAGGTQLESTVAAQPQDDVVKLLEGIRDKIFNYLENKLDCTRGQEESPIFALPHLLQELQLQRNFLTHYKLRFRCEMCNFQEMRSTQKVILTLPRVTSNFSVLDATILASCLNCRGLDQKRKIVFDKLPPCIMMHFVEGLPHQNIELYDFEFRKVQYKVSCIVKYKCNPNHFSAWLRDLKGDVWMECDDLKPGPSCFRYKTPDVGDPSQCHVLVWESISQSTSTSLPPATVDSQSNDFVPNTNDYVPEAVFLAHHQYCKNVITEKKPYAAMPDETYNSPVEQRAEVQTEVAIGPFSVSPSSIPSTSHLPVSVYSNGNISSPKRNLKSDENASRYLGDHLYCGPLPEDMICGSSPEEVQRLQNPEECQVPEVGREVTALGPPFLNHQLLPSEPISKAVPILHSKPSIGSPTGAVTITPSLWNNHHTSATEVVVPSRPAFIMNSLETVPTNLIFEVPNNVSFVNKVDGLTVQGNFVTVPAEVQRGGTTRGRRGRGGRGRGQTVRKNSNQESGGRGRRSRGRSRSGSSRRPRRGGRGGRGRTNDDYLPVDSNEGLSKNDNQFANINHAGGIMNLVIKPAEVEQNNVGLKQSQSNQDLLVRQESRPLPAKIKDMSVYELALATKNGPIVSSVALPCKRTASEMISKQCSSLTLKRINGTDIQLVVKDAKTSRKSSRSFDSYQMKTNSSTENQ